MKKVFYVFVLVAGIVALSCGLQAQTVNQTINANATVLSAITITASSDLEFGDVLPGINKIVKTNSGVVGLPTGGTVTETAGKFELSGEDGREISITVSALPATLSDGATHTLPITYLTATNAGCGYELTDTDSPTGTADANLVAAGVITTNFSALGRRWMHIGGQVAPTTTQVAGSYTAPITIQVQYTGN